MERLKRRTDFRAVAAGSRAAAGVFVLQARRRGDGGLARVGFTVSRQVGNAVERNRVKRRLREVVRQAAPAGNGPRAGYDYVLVARRAALQAPFDRLIQELDAALLRVHARERQENQGSQATGEVGRRPPHEPGSRGSASRRNPPRHEH